jgi:Holliday junction DNA helicase RuvA
MIALLRGEVALRRSDHVVVICGGVGYRLAVSTHTLAHVPAVGAEVTLHTQLVVRDDALVLYGFHSEQERELFLMLLAVQSVGPKVAVAVLCGGAPRDLLRAIAAGDASRFQAVPGIGKRTAERIIVELRDKVGAAAGPALAPSDLDDPRILARDGLVELGFDHGEAERLLARATGGSAEELLAAALRAARAAEGAR